MKAIASILVSVLVAACGGSDKSENTTPASDDMAGGGGEEMGAGAETPTPTPTPEAEPPPPPPPKKFSATVAVAPVKGSKMKAATVSLEQEEGKPVAVSGSFDGLKPGKYVWVIHENGDCKSNATKAGKPWATTETATIAMEVTKEAPTGAVAGEQPWMLDGEQTVVGKALVLHEVKKDKPGKALACGVISSGEAAAPPAEGAAPAGGGGGGGF